MVRKNHTVKHNFAKKLYVFFDYYDIEDHYVVNRDTKASIDCYSQKELSFWRDFFSKTYDIKKVCYFGVTYSIRVSFKEINIL